MTLRLVAIIAAFGVAWLLRTLPHRLAPAGSGVDHWFWTAYIQRFKETREFPPRLPQYILDEEQWYPPVFPLLMSLLPSRVFDRFNRQIAVFIDLLRMAVVMTFAAWTTQGSVSATFLAAAIYATTPIQIFYNTQLNPRGLAALQLDCVMMLLLWMREYHGPPWAWVLVLLVCGVILLTHKMTTQLLWFVCLISAVLYRDWRLAALIPASMAVAFVISGGFYRKVLIAHWDIVRFWSKNWPWIGADPIRESPVYAEGDYERPGKMHPKGVRGAMRQLFLLFGFNPAAWIACLFVYERLFIHSKFLIYPTFLLVWLLLTVLLSVLTTFVPIMKGIGAGYLYLYNASFLAATLFALTYRYTSAPRISVAFAVCALLLNLGGLAVYYVTFGRSKRWKIDDEFAQILALLQKLPDGLVMCLPPIWYDAVAYNTGKSVLCGGHGYGFRRLEPTFPRLLQPLDETVRRYNVRYLLTIEGALTERARGDISPVRTTTVGPYHLYELGA